jgi:uncharacterized protein YbjT (DUF2867 family)
MIAVTGTSGKLGGLVLDDLLKVVPSDQLVANVRSPKKAGRSVYVLGPLHLWITNTSR